MNNERARSFFDGDLDVSRILRNISLETGVPITTDTLVLLDEIQECPRALTALKYFCEDAREYHVIATGSYMGIARHAGTSYPVGKVDTLTLRPMDFTEYLRAIGQGMMADAISDGTGIADLDSAKRDLRREAGTTLLDMAVGVSLCPFHHLAIILKEGQTIAEKRICHNTSKKEARDGMRDYITNRFSDIIDVAHPIKVVAKLTTK